MEQVTERNIHNHLQEVFDNLAEHGILARANFFCCMSCATYELGDKIDEKEEFWAGVYYHEQNAESLEREGSCYVGFFTKDGHSSEDAAAKACEVFENEGLEVEWNGSASKKIHITVPNYEGRFQSSFGSHWKESEK